MRHFIILLISIFMISNSFAAENSNKGYEYSFIERPNQKIHVLRIDLKRFDMALVSAHNSVFGREKIEDIAKREDATIAVNAGFFQIGDNEDGRPTGTLIIDGEIYGLRINKHAVFVIRNNVPSVEIWHPNIELTIGEHKFVPKKFNRFLKKSEVILYSKKWGDDTLTPYSTRNEISIRPELVVSDVNTHGNNRIPYDGYVLSVPKDVDVSSIKINDVVDLKGDDYSMLDENTSAIMGIPYLIMDNRINPDLSDEQKHARSSIGIDKDGKIVILVVEHAYTQVADSLTLKDVQGIVHKNKVSADSLSVNDLKKLIAQEVSGSNSAEGMTTKELAHFMKELGCVAAINLDGGGSSALYIDNKYVNRSVGDKDEAAGIEKVRPVSDAIIFTKKEG